MTYDIIVPNNKIISCKEIKFEDIIDLAKANENNDDSSIRTKLNSFLINASSFNIVEKTYALLKLRALCIDDSIRLSFNNKDISIDTDLILKQINSFDYDGHFQKKLINNILFTFNMPNNFIININELFAFVIKEIQFQNETLNIYKLSKEEQLKAINLLPANVFDSIVKYIGDQILKTEIVIVRPTASLNNNPLTMNFLGVQPFNFLKTVLLSYDLDYCRELIYVLSKKIDPSFLLKSTLKDINFYMRLYKDEMKQESSALKL